jgi:nitroreductase
MPLLPLDPDELLSTTRAVRKRLDFDRPVERSLIEECLRIALQAPTGGNRQRWHFVVVTDPAKRRAIAELYRLGWDVYLASPTAAPNLHFEDPVREAVQRRVGDSAQYLADNLERAPVFLIPCLPRRFCFKLHSLPPSPLWLHRRSDADCLSLQSDQARASAPEMIHHPSRA